jgi:DNA-binding PadR family transcriptional regulator
MEEDEDYNRLVEYLKEHYPKQDLYLRIHLILFILARYGPMNKNKIAHHKLLGSQHAGRLDKILKQLKAIGYVDEKIEKGRKRTYYVLTESGYSELKASEKSLKNFYGIELYDP